MKKFNLLTAVFFVIALVLAVVFYFRESNEVPQVPQLVTVLRPAPRFELKDSTGKAHSLEEYRGKVVVLHFWASWCPPCLSEIPHWLALSERFKDKSVVWLAVSLDSNWKDALKILPVQDRLPKLVSLLDEGGKTPEEFGTYQFPETYLINSKLEVVSKWIGPQDWASKEISAAIDKQLLLHK